MNDQSEIPILDATEKNFKEKLNYLLWSTHSSSDFRNDRERPYDGQPWTDDGERGKALVHGLTMRNIRDCLIKAMLRCHQESNDDILAYAIDKPGRKKLLNEKVDEGTWRTQDVYEVDFSKVDPLAIAQNLTCEIEKMMGIYPNVPTLESKEVR